MSQRINIHENGVHAVFEVTDEQDVRFLHFDVADSGDYERWEEQKRRKCRLVEVHVSGENQDDHHGSKHTGTNPGKRLKLKEWHDSRNGTGRKITMVLHDQRTGLAVESHMQFIGRLPVVRTWTAIVNEGETPVGLEYVSSFAYTGIGKGGLGDRNANIRLHIPHHTWYGEAQWKGYTLPELGLHHVHDFSMKRISFSNTGTWSSSQVAPCAFLENLETGSGYFWQIEHNGSWHWEISDMANELYLLAAGPTEQENHWWKNLKPGETFVSVPVSVGVCQGGLGKAVELMTLYRRQIRRPNPDNATLPVIFNDYMNCLFGDPTTEKLLPLIDAAAEAGCEYFCVDCGWYADGEWWDGVGEWLPSARRFPNGIEEVLDYIRKKGMVPGLWLEIEVMGIRAAKAAAVPDDWFFVRHGKRVIDHSRYQLDFRNPDVRAYADGVMGRLVEQYGVGYIKMDYNINAGMGTELHADSFGDGLLEHNRAYLRWLDQIFAKYPHLIIENCGSGGMRMDYAMLSRHSIQSSSDQTDYRKNAYIAAASATLVTPEQCAVWSYPLRDGDAEEVTMNMVNALLLRVHQSGHLAEMDGERLALVKEGISYYKKIRSRIREGLPFWPLGIPGFGEPWISYGLRHGNACFVAVWRMHGEEEAISIPIPDLRGNEKVAATLEYPARGDAEFAWIPAAGALRVRLPRRYTARLFKLEWEESFDGSP